METSAIKSHYKSLASASSQVLSKSLEDESRLACFHVGSLEDLALWKKVLNGRGETAVLNYAIQELQYALNSLLMGMYRQAFASLRLTVELALNAVGFSVDRLKLVEWNQGSFDTNWAALIGEEGIYSPRYCRAFFPELKPHASTYQTEAKDGYRLLSEFVHGNQSTWGATPDHFVFKRDMYEKWFERANPLIESVLFAYVLRYSRELTSDQVEELSERMATRFSHIEPVRVSFGGVANTP